MALLRNVKLVCEKTQEAVDEPYLKFKFDQDTTYPETIQWGPESMDDGETRNIDIVDRRRFNSDIRVELWEYDRGSLKDDHLEDFYIHATPGEYSHFIDFPRMPARVQATAKYRLFYSVMTDEQEHYQLYLDHIYCGNAQEITDEPYLIVNGAQVWGPASMDDDNKDYRDINISAIDFTTPGITRIELWERDDYRSDQLGDALEIDEDQARAYAQACADHADYECEHEFSGRGARYELKFRVFHAA